MTTAHIFYIPVMIAVGMLAGFFLGRRSAELEAQERRKRLKRRKAMEARRKGATESPEAPSASPADDA
ncbi:hypothetical protein DV096_19040 [Bradymonadaceae bacterium TMQ3]|uniref:DUF1049 domain-containing protein n=1 Tax=Lujinxingia sediminis TaxID=2480984 RepID=A0ABY0CQP3_9DELT|nr:hypothetical protein [Lujinxingia sediminis]RDV36549.1 hypothetical protein DV096_19040 [Bradymonadaceae bacterium TMQ3]RVU42400.1 hypothetical protein EA187_16105 [Lujinxingia sediminis]TXC74599.1 hypothetical protein FRC91_15925 [Bradymonadales bacterium TMQ1]